jgi:hypothetical protein
VWNGNDATINGATTGVSGLANYDSGEAYSFNRSNGDDVQTPIGDTFSTFSWSAWVYLDSVSNNPQTVISTRDDSDNGAGLRERGNDQWEFYGMDSDAGSFNTVSNSSLNTGTTYHLVGVIDTNQIRLYVDGSLAGSSPFGTYSNGNYDIRIGEQARGGGHFPGDIDDPRIYDKGLTDSEASNLYNTGSISG